jgi:hypothetical protein
MPQAWKRHRDGSRAVTPCATPVPDALPWAR